MEPWIQDKCTLKVVGGSDGGFIRAIKRMMVCDVAYIDDLHFGYST